MCFKSELLDPPKEKDKSFSSFQKDGLPGDKLKPPVPFPTPIKWKEYQLDPLGAASAASLRGIKLLRDFKKKRILAVETINAKLRF